MTKFSVDVIPGSSKPGPDGRHGGTPRVRVKSPATNGRANAEAQRVLQELLRGSVRLTAGARSRRKTFDADVAPALVEQRLRDAFGD